MSLTMVWNYVWRKVVQERGVQYCFIKIYVCKGECKQVRPVKKPLKHDDGLCLGP